MLNVILFLIALQEIFVRNVSEKKEVRIEETTPEVRHRLTLACYEEARLPDRKCAAEHQIKADLENSLQVTTRTTRKKSVLSSGRRRTKKIRNIPFLFIFHLFFKNDIRSGCNQRVEWSHAAKMTMVFAVQEKAPTKGVGQNGRTKKTDFKYENADFKR